MELTRINRTAEYVLNASVDGVEERFQASYGSSIEFVPRNLRVRWYFRSTEGWVLDSVRVGGMVVKKDGSVGARPGGRDFEEGGALTEDSPQWLRDVVAEYQPSGTVIMP